MPTRRNDARFVSDGSQYLSKPQHCYICGDYMYRGIRAHRVGERWGHLGCVSELFYTGRVLKPADLYEDGNTGAMAHGAACDEAQVSGRAPEGGAVSE